MGDPDVWDPPFDVGARVLIGSDISFRGRPAPRTIISVWPLLRKDTWGNTSSVGYQFTVQHDHTGAITLEHQYSLRLNPYPGSRVSFSHLQRPSLSQLRPPRGQLPRLVPPPAAPSNPQDDCLSQAQDMTGSVEGQFDSDEDQLFSSQSLAEAVPSFSGATLDHDFGSESEDGMIDCAVAASLLESLVFDDDTEVAEGAGQLCSVNTTPGESGTVNTTPGPSALDSLSMAVGTDGSSGGEATGSVVSVGEAKCGGDLGDIASDSIDSKVVSSTVLGGGDTDKGDSVTYDHQDKQSVEGAAQLVDMPGSPYAKSDITVDVENPSSVPSTKTTSSLTVKQSTASLKTPLVRSRSLTSIPQATLVPARCSSAKFGQPISTTRCDNFTFSRSVMTDQQCAGQPGSSTTPVRSVARTSFTSRPDQVVEQHGHGQGAVQESVPIQPGTTGRLISTSKPQTTNESLSMPGGTDISIGGEDPGPAVRHLGTSDHQMIQDKQAGLSPAVTVAPHGDISPGTGNIDTAADGVTTPSQVLVKEIMPTQSTACSAPAPLGAPMSPTVPRTKNQFRKQVVELYKSAKMAISASPTASPVGAAYAASTSPSPSADNSLPETLDDSTPCPLTDSECSGDEEEESGEEQSYVNPFFTVSSGSDSPASSSSESFSSSVSNKARQKVRKRRKDLETSREPSESSDEEEEEFSDPDWDSKPPTRKNIIKRRKVCIVNTPGSGLSPLSTSNKSSKVACLAKQSPPSLDTSNRASPAKQRPIPRAGPCMGSTSCPPENSGLKAPSHSFSGSATVTPTKTKGGKSKINRNKSPPPLNPHGVNFVNKDGVNLDPRSKEYLEQFAMKDKIKVETKKKYEREFTLFTEFVARTETNGDTVVEELLASSLDKEEVCRLLCSYLNNRVNLTVWRVEGKIQMMDTTSLCHIWYSLVYVIKDKTGYDVIHDKAFKLARESKAANMRASKKVPGLGQLNNQPLPLDRAQLAYLMHHDQLCTSTPQGITWLFWLLFTTYFMPRIREEASNVTRGSFKKAYNPDGSVKYIIYVPQGTTKRDQGNDNSVNASKFKKHPVALPCTVKKIDFIYVYDVMCSHLDKLPLQPDEPDRAGQKMFKQIKKNVPAPGETFFYPQDLGAKSYDHLLRTMVWATDMKVGPLQLQNQCIRPTMFCLHTLLGITTTQMMAMAGHSSEKTNLAYQRGFSELYARINASVMKCVGGVVPIYPDQESVLLCDGSYVLPRPFAVEVGKPDVDAGFMPLDALDDELYQAVIDDPQLPLHPAPGIHDQLLPVQAEAPVHERGAAEDLDDLFVTVTKPTEAVMNAQLVPTCDTPCRSRRDQNITGRQILGDISSNIPGASTENLISKAGTNGSKPGVDPSTPTTEHGRFTFKAVSYNLENNLTMQSMDKERKSC